MTADVLAELKPRVRRQLPEDRLILAAYACSFKSKDGFVVLARGGVFIVADSGWFSNSAPPHAAWAKHLGGSKCDLQLWGEHVEVQFRSVGEAEAVVSAISEAGEAARLERQPGLVRLGPDERLVSRCVYLGGANVALAVKAEVDLLFGLDDLQVHRPPILRGRDAITRLPYAPQFEVQLSGPGRFTTGGGFVGGGFGLIGAAEGMAIAGVLNALTTRTKVLSVIAVLSAHYEAFFLCQEHAPDELRHYLAPVFLRARQLGQHPPVAEPAPPAPEVPDLVAQLERLSALHRAGALTDDEFQRAKAQALGSE